MRTVERARTRRELAREAGMGSVSGVSVLAGVLVAYGAVALLAAVIAGVGGAVGIDSRDLSPSDWQDAGIGAAVALGIVLLVSYFFGGYVAGRMGRRAGLAHGAAVFVLGLVIAAGLAAAAATAADGDTVADELRSRGIPTSADDWRDLGLYSGIGLLVAMLAGSLLGGVKGERWHGVLVTRAQDPRFGPGADRDRHLDITEEQRTDAERGHAPWDGPDRDRTEHLPGTHAQDGHEHEHRV